MEGFLGFIHSRAPLITLLAILILGSMSGSCGQGPMQWTRLLIEADLSGLDALEHDAAIDLSMAIIRVRLQEFGVRSFTVDRLGANRIEVTVPGVADSERLSKILITKAELEFKLLTPLEQFEEVLTRLDRVFKIKQGIEDTPVADDLTRASGSDSTADDLLVFFEGPDFETPGSLMHMMRAYTNGGIFISEDNQPALKRFLADPEAQLAIPPRYEFVWGQEAAGAPGYPDGHLLYLTHKKSELSGKHLTMVTTEPDRNSPEFYCIFFELDRDGSYQFARVTERNVGKQLAIVVDGRVYSAPIIEGRIAQGRGMITGRFSLEDAQDLAIALGAGSLPVPWRIVESSSSLQGLSEG